MATDESVNHDLVCTKSLEKRASNRHAAVMRSLLDYFTRCSLIDKTKFMLNAEQQNYSNFGVRSNAPVPAAALAPGAIPVHKDATTALA